MHLQRPSRTTATPQTARVLALTVVAALTWFTTGAVIAASISDATAAPDREAVTVTAEAPTSAEPLPSCATEGERACVDLDEHGNGVVTVYGPDGTVVSETTLIAPDPSPTLGP